MSDEDRARLREVILDLARKRGPEKTFCPSEAARACAEDWRDLMPVVRAVADDLRRDGRIEVLRNGEPVEAKSAEGPIRLRLSAD